MKAVFKKSNRILFVTFLTFAFIWSGLCVFILVKNSTTTVGDIIACSFVTIIFCSFALIPFVYNHKAYLHIDDNKIIGKFGFLKRLECDINDVTLVLDRFNTLQIFLKDRKYYISGIQNAYAISIFLQQKMPFSPCEFTDQEIENINERSKNQKKNIILVFCALGLSFAWLFITIFLTGARDLPEFNRLDWIFFWVMWVLEIPTVIAMFAFAIRSGKINTQLEKQIYNVKRSALETAPLLWGPGHLKAVLTDSICSQRITVYCDCVENDPRSACYNVEIFDENYKLRFLYQSEMFSIENFDEMFVDFRVLHIN